MSLSDKNKQQQVPENNVENHMHQGQPNMGNSFLSGIKQRLLSFIFQGIWNEETDDTLVSFINSHLIAQSSFSMFYLALFLCFTCSRKFILEGYRHIAYSQILVSFSFLLSLTR